MFSVLKDWCVIYDQPFLCLLHLIFEVPVAFFSHLIISSELIILMQVSKCCQNSVEDKTIVFDQANIILSIASQPHKMFKFIIVFYL